MPDPNTTSSIKPGGVDDPEHGGEGDGIQEYDHSDLASSRSGVPTLHTRSRSGRSSVTSTSTEKFLRRAGFSAFYYNPITQVCLLGLVCFLCPGSFNALNGLGAAGRVDSGVNSNSNSALYSTFTVAAFFAGCVFLFSGLLYLHPRRRRSIAFNAAWSLDTWDYSESMSLMILSVSAIGAPRPVEQMFLLP